MKRGQVPIWVVIIGILILLAFVALWLSFNFATPEEGSHTGYIVEAGYRGLFWKTHYIKVVDSRFAQYSGGSDQGWWYYGLENESDLTLYTRATALQNNTLVVVHYRCDLITPQWQSSEACKVTGIDAS